MRCLPLERRVKMTETSTIVLKSTEVGEVLVGANGRTLYLFTADEGTKSVCYGECETYWPPLIDDKPTAGAGLDASLLGTTQRTDGTLQVTYNGHPLYFFAVDESAGDIKGQGYESFDGIWWTVSAAGAEITEKV
jgi:predicted lipoprotein with Yx(FWY)xxD motif